MSGERPRAALSARVGRTDLQRLKRDTDLHRASVAMTSVDSAMPGWVCAIEKRRVASSVIAVFAIVAAATLFWCGQGQVTRPQIESVVRLTHDGQPKSTPAPMATDGSRMYCKEQLEIAQTSVAEVRPRPWSLIW
jgi:hypothetical protein